MSSGLFDLVSLYLSRSSLTWFYFIRLKSIAFELIRLLSLLTSIRLALNSFRCHPVKYNSMINGARNWINQTPDRLLNLDMYRIRIRNRPFHSTVHSSFDLQPFFVESWLENRIPNALNFLIHYPHIKIDWFLCHMLIRETKLTTERLAHQASSQFSTSRPQHTYSYPIVSYPSASHPMHRRLTVLPLVQIFNEASFARSACFDWVLRVCSPNFRDCLRCHQI